MRPCKGNTTKSSAHPKKPERRPLGSAASRKHRRQPFEIAQTAARYLRKSSLHSAGAAVQGKSSSTAEIDEAGTPSGGGNPRDRFLSSQPAPASVGSLAGALLPRASGFTCPADRPWGSPELADI